MGDHFPALIVRTSAPAQLEQLSVDAQPDQPVRVDVQRSTLHYTNGTLPGARVIPPPDGV
jgi:hypothetical protein